MKEKEDLLIIMWVTPVDANYTHISRKTHFKIHYISNFWVII